MIFAKNFARNYEKNNNTWNIRCLVDETFVPATQRIILKIVGFLYCTGASTATTLRIFFKTKTLLLQLEQTLDS